MFDTSNMEKILESQFLRFIDTSSNSTPVWKVIGVGVEEVKSVIDNQKA